MKLPLALTVAAACILPLGLPSTTKAQSPVEPYQKVRKIAIGGEGGWDFLEVDAANRKLYIARSTRVIVVDLDGEKVVGEIAETPGVHGIAFAPDLDRGFTSNGGDSTVTAFDLKTLKTLGKIKANGRPDIITFEPVTRRILSFNHGTNDITAIDPKAMTVVGSLAPGGCPELARIRREGSRLRQPGRHERDRRVRRRDHEGGQEILAQPRRGGRPAWPSIRSNASCSAPAPIGSWSSPTPIVARSSRRSRSARAPTAASSTPSGS